MVFLPGVVRFVKAHFSDLSLLKSHLEKSNNLNGLMNFSFKYDCRLVCVVELGGEFADEQIEILKLLFEKASKYVLSPDLDIEININGKVRLIVRRIYYYMRIEIIVYVDYNFFPSHFQGDFCG